MGGGIVAVRREAHEMLVAAAIRNLDEAKPVTRRDQTHGFGIDGDRTRCEDALGQIFLVQIDCHRAAIRLRRFQGNAQSLAGAEPACESTPDGIG